VVLKQTIATDNAAFCYKALHKVRSEGMVKTAVFFGVRPCSLVKRYWRFRR